MNKTIQWIIGVIAIVALILSLQGLIGDNNQSELLGATGTRFPNGLSADTISPIVGQLRGTTLSLTGASTFGGTMTVTTSNTATSTLKVGCIQTTATSTATAVRFVLSSAGTTTPTFGAGTANGGVSWQYGTCPV